MYEHKTYENILDNLLESAKKQDSNIDTREGSIIYNILAPCAIELTNMYIQLDAILNETFADTASRKYLIKRAKERGLEIKEETKAIRQGEFNIDVPIGSRFSLNTLNYIVTEKIKSEKPDNLTISETIDLTKFPEGLTYQGDSGEWNGLSINATNGKFGNNNGQWVQCNAGTILTFKVGDFAKVTVIAYYSANNFGIHIENNICTITCTANDYLSTINVTSTYVENQKFKLECETSGIIGNLDSGTLIPISEIQGLTYCELTDVLIPAEDSEDTEVFRQRYFEFSNSKSFGGNIPEYKEKVNNIDGVGGVKVIRAWNGGGTVKLVIINSDYNTASTVLVDNVQNIVDPTQSKGEGVGTAPIGHVVTVESVTAEDIYINTNITFNGGWNYTNSKEYLEETINDYFLELCKDWENTENLIIRISQIESRLLDLECVIDVGDTTINGKTSNFKLDSYTIPTLGEITCTTEN